MLELLNMCTVVFRQHQKKYLIFQFVYCILSVGRYNKCSKFNLIVLFIFLSKHKTLYKENFLENFSNKQPWESMMAVSNAIVNVVLCCSKVFYVFGLYFYNLHLSHAGSPEPYILF